MKKFREGQIVKLNTTGARVKVIDVVPVGQSVFYKVEEESGDTRLINGKLLRDGEG